MVSKTFFFSKIKLNQIVINKYSIQKFYNKYFISKLYLNTKKRLLLVDNFSNQVLILSKVYQTIFMVKLLKRGCSLVSDLFIYKNSNLYSSLYTGVGLVSKITNIVSRFITRLNLSVKKRDFFILYQVKRGGYYGLARGLKGFIPFIQLVYDITSFNSFKLQSKYIILYNISNANFLISNYPNLKIIHSGFKYNFNSKIGKRSRIFLGGRLYVFFYLYSTLNKNWLKKFKVLNINYNKFILKYIFKYFFKKLFV